MCGASSNGISAVLAHRYPDKTERPIGYASCLLPQSHKLIIRK